MPQPRKYRNAAERQRAYRARHAQAKQLKLDALRKELGELRREIRHRRGEEIMGKRIDKVWVVRAAEVHCSTTSRSALASWVRKTNPPQLNRVAKIILAKYDRLLTFLAMYLTLDK